MFLQSSNHRSSAPQDHESARPFLRARSRSPDTVETIFSAEDNDFGPSTDKDVTATHPKGHSVRFEDSVQVIAPPLRSTLASRETGVNKVNDYLQALTIYALQNMSLIQMT